MQILKYSANGNDFVIFHSFIKRDRSQLAIKLCDRHNGIGADGLIVLIPHPTLDFEWEFYNSDGSIASMCGNGSRACASYAFSQGLAPAKMRFLTGAGEIGAIVEKNMIETELTKPIIYSNTIEEFNKTWWLIDTGVPHLIAIVDNIEEFNIEQARELRYKHNANVNIAKIDNDNIHVRTYERGVENETQACGTGMASAFYRAYKENKIKNSCKVYPKSGDTLYLSHNGETILFKGEVKKTFETFQDIVY